MTFPKSVNIDKFKIFLENYRAKYPYDDVAFHLDNLGVHRSKVSRERMDELGIEQIYVPPYSPWLNGGIEETWSIGKGAIRRERMKRY